jgi:catechol 2,3-dioxygenase-like lactoylglutathione lyase family enzyme
VATGRHREGAVNSAIPILPSADLDRTIAFWQALGFDVAGRYDGYLVTHANGVEIHFSHDPDVPSASPTSAFIHVQNAAVLWKELKSNQVTGLEPLQDQDYGLREFVIVDPDGNRIRIGSPID